MCSSSPHHINELTFKTPTMAPEKTDAADCPPATGTSDTVAAPISPPSAATNGGTAPGDSSFTLANTSTVSVDSTNGEHDPYFEPVVTLPEVTIKTLEEDEEEVYKGRCKLFRYVQETDGGGEWKERGTGNVKLLKNDDKDTVRLLMRQEKTLKVRANHYITPYMRLRPNCGSDRAFVWYVMFDFADEEPKPEMFAIRFANAENARIFKDAFEEAVGYITASIAAGYPGEEEDGDLVEEEEEVTSDEEEKEDKPTTPEEKESTKDMKASPRRSSKSSADDQKKVVDDVVVEGLEKLKVQDEQTATGAAS